MRVRKVAAALGLLLAFGCLLYSLPAKAEAEAAASCSAPSFNRAPALSENFVNYKAVAFADFNGDGKTDAVAGTLGSGGSGTVKVYLGDGVGGFGAPGTFQTGDSNIAWDVATGDFNKDGKVDIVSANNFSDSVSLLLGNGSGGFGNGIMFSVGSSPRSIAVADFDRDGSPDIATANYFSNNVTVLLNDGAGGLGIGSARKTINVAANPQYIRTADFNNDNKPDLVVSSQNANGVTVLLGDGAGGFTAAGPSFGPLNRATLGVAAADFDGDGAVDLAVCASDWNALSIWRGDGAGHFTAQGTVGAGSGARFVVASDFDGDGKADLLVTNADGYNVSLLRNLGGGSFASQRVFVAGTTQPLYAAAADLNGDHKTDAVVVNVVDLSVMLGDGAGGFISSEAFPLSSDSNSGAVAMAEGDFNTDRKSDLAVATGNRLIVMQGGSGGKLQPAFTGPFGTPAQFGAVVTGDFDRDGKLDIAATGGAGNGQLTVYHGDGAGGFPRTSVTRIDTATGWLQVADFNEDGFDDLLVPIAGSSPVSVYINDGTGKFLRKIVPGFGVQGKTVVVGDFNGDGHADLVGQKPFINPTFADVAVFLGDGAGNFNQSPGGVYTTSGFPDALLADDFNGDGKTDLLVSVSTGISNTSGIFFLAGDGAGNLAAAMKISDLVANSLATGDFNADGNADLAATAEDISFVLQGDGAANFSTPVRFPVGRAVRKVVATDLNGDGKHDIATANGAGDVAVLLNTCSFVPDALPSLSVSDASVTEGDGGTVNATFTVQLSAASTKTVGVSFYAYASPTSLSAVQPAAGRLLFAPGVTSRTFTVPVWGDTTDEFDEKFGVRLVFPANARVARARGEGTIVDNDPPPSVSINDVNVNETNSGLTGAVFNVTLSAVSAKPITVSYTTAAGTAAAGTDFEATTGTLTFNVGETSKTVSVNVIGDGTFEPDETFFVNLGDPSNVTIADGQGVGTIVNDDAGVRFNSATQSVSEGAGSVQIVVKRVGSLTGSSTVAYSTADGTASERTDYNLAQGTLRFGPGESEKSFTVFVTDDRYAEGNETFNVALNAVDGATTDTPSTLTVTVEDNDGTTGTSPVKWAATFDPSFFVRQHYLDFLNREPDAAGLAFWTDQMTNCGNSNVEVCRVNVSAAFFQSIEFQQTGYLVYKTYKAGYGDLAPDKPVPVRIREFAADTQELGRFVQVGAPEWEARLEANKRAYFDAFVATQRFTAQYPSSMTAAQFVDRLNTNTGFVLTQSERDGLVSDLSSGAKTRAQVLRAVAENTALHQRQFNRAFVLMQYFGYLRRDPDSGNDTDFTGYNFWLGKLNEFNGNFVNAEMVKAFLQSDEYVKRFGQ